MLRGFDNTQLILQKVIWAFALVAEYVYKILVQMKLLCLVGRPSQQRNTQGATICPSAGIRVCRGAGCAAHLSPG